jgi:hypothetical protein
MAPRIGDELPKQVVGPFAGGSEISVADVKLFVVFGAFKAGVYDHVPTDVLAGFPEARNATCERQSAPEGRRVVRAIFAMLMGGALAVKPPPAEVEAATTAGRGEPLAMERGRVMKGSLVVKEPPQRWYAIAERARPRVRRR